MDPGKGDLRAAIGLAPADLASDGTYPTIYATWFDHPGGSIAN
ncbi:MAG: hypothetical protein ACE5GC_02385 [Acidimicrobiia bacterium]